MILAKEFYPRREIPIRRVKRNGYRCLASLYEYTYLHPSTSPVETRASERTNKRARSCNPPDVFLSVRAGVRLRSACVRTHRTGKSYFLPLGQLKIDPPGIVDSVEDSCAGLFSPAGSCNVYEYIIFKRSVNYWVINNCKKRIIRVLVGVLHLFTPNGQLNDTKV